MAKNRNAAKAAAEEAKRLAEEAAQKAKDSDDPEAKAAAEEAERKAAEAEADAEKDDDDDEPKGKQPVLDSPKSFGIWINYGKGQVLKRFLAGKTPLTPEEETACKASPYVKDNGAEVIYR